MSEKWKMIVPLMWEKEIEYAENDSGSLHNEAFECLEMAWTIGKHWSYSTNVF